MAEYVPFVNSLIDCRIARSAYPDAAAFRVTLQSAEKICSQLQNGFKLWIDGGVDGLGSPDLISPEYKINLKYKAYIARFAGYDRIADPTFQAKPDRHSVESFTAGVLSKIEQSAPGCEWISIPQLPQVDGASRNKINKWLSESTGTWRAKKNFRGKLILPVIFTHQRQLNLKTDRNKKVALVLSCVEACNADGVWMVDSSLNDQDGIRNFEHTRFPAIVNFHEELNEKLGSEIITIAGPYWALNVLLWARGLVRYAGIGVGKSYQYHIAGGKQQIGDTRIALRPLRRLAVWSHELKRWLGDALQRIPSGEKAYAEFQALEKNFELLHDDEQARVQVARFYRDWFKGFEAQPLSTRALALYQDFSSAYVLGKSIKEPIPDRVRSAAKIPKQFMVNCL